MKTWLSQGSRISPNLVSVGRQWEIKTNEDSRIAYIREKIAHQHAQNATFGLFVAARFLGRPDGCVSDGSTFVRIDIELDPHIRLRYRLVSSQCCSLF